MKRPTAKHLPLLIALAGTAAATTTAAEADQTARDRGPSPSAAAFEACANHKLGDRVNVTTGSDKTLIGNCRLYQGNLAASTHVRHKKKDKGWWHTLTSWF